MQDEEYADYADSEDSNDADQKEEFDGIKEQMYQDKLAQLKHQLQQLRDSSHPEYRKRLKKIDAAYKDRVRLNDLWKELELESVERDYQMERQQAGKEFEEKKIELKENLLLELEEKKKIVEQERYSLDLANDSMEYKTMSTRKLRRRGNDPPPMVDKRRKPVTTTLNLLLDEKEVEEDLKLLKIKMMPMKKTVPTIPPTVEVHSNEPKIENGKLYFDRKWFHKGQAVMIECKDGTRFNAVLLMAASEIIMVRKVPDNIRLKITLPQLAHGKYLVRRRTNM